MKTKDLLEMFSKVLGMNIEELEIGFNAFINDLKVEGSK